MLPILLDLGFLKIYTYGVFLVLSFFWSAFFVWKNISLTSFKEDEVFDGIFFSLLGAVFVGRLQFVLLNFGDFGYNLLKFVLLNGYPGIGAFGFVLGFFISLLIFSSIHKLSFTKLIDYVVPAFLLAIAITKLGGFFAGTEVGTQTTFFLSLKYPALDGSRHLTALYESIVLFAGTFFSYKILRTIRRNQLYEGFNAVFFTWYYALVVVVFDFVRSFKMMIGGISFDLVGGGLFLLTSSGYLIYYFRQLMMQKLMKIFSFQKKKK